MLTLIGVKLRRDAVHESSGMRAYPGDAVAVGVRIAGQPRPGVQQGSHVEDAEHEQVAVVEPQEVVEHPLAQPCALRGVLKCML